MKTIKMVETKHVQEMTFGKAQLDWCDLAVQVRGGGG